MKNIGAVNLAVIALLLLLCAALFGGGLVGIAVWIIIKLLLPVLGFVGALLLLVSALFRKKRSRAHTALSLVLCLVCIAPILFTLNILPVAYPASIYRTSPAVTVQWPLREETIVGWGGDNVKNNLPHAAWGSERWAYDMVMEPHGINSPDLTTYGIWGQEVVSPVEGTVVAAFGDEPDIPPNTEEFLSLEGNYVYIEIHETGTYLLLNHFQQNGVAVSVGDTVAPGDFLGYVGNSGTTSEPHLHIHHQRQNPTEVLHPLLAESLPLYFENREGIAMPIGGTTIHPLP